MVMYTTVIHSRSRDGRHREALALVWEMEQANCLLDLPAYRVIVKLCVALYDPERAFWYLSKLKEAGLGSSRPVTYTVIWLKAMLWRGGWPNASS